MGGTLLNQRRDGGESVPYSRKPVKARGWERKLGTDPGAGPAAIRGPWYATTPAGPKWTGGAALPANRRVSSRTVENRQILRLS